ncbi:alpha/beta hydrolase [bacterium]|nr:alpha/beta hydrolase [bacterium]
MKQFLLCVSLLLAACSLSDQGHLKVMRIQTNGIELAVIIEGSGTEDVIFLHHGGGNLMMWQAIVPYLRDDYRFVYVDQRGHGRSDKPAKGNHIDTMAMDIIGIMDALKIEKAHVLGASLGAEVALALAAYNPQRVKSLVLEGALTSAYGPYSAGEKPESLYGEEVSDRIAHWAGIPARIWDDEEAMVEAMKLDYGDYWNEIVEQYVRYGGQSLETGQMTEGWIKQARDDYFNYVFGYRFEEYYPIVQCPVLMLPSDAEWNDAAARQAIEKMSLLISDCKVEAVPKLMHAYGWILMPEKLAPVISDFWALID